MHTKWNYCLLHVYPGIGLCEVSINSKLMVYPGNQTGTLQLVDLIEEGGVRSTDSICSVHQHDISCIAIDSHGSRVATASTKVHETNIHITVNSLQSDHQPSGLIAEVFTFQSN